jgi:TonB dependent receptor
VSGPISDGTVKVAVLPLRNFTGDADWRVDAVTDDPLGHGYRVDAGARHEGVARSVPERVRRLSDDLTRVNAERLPSYHRLDVRADRKLTWGGTNLVLFFEVQNLYNRENISGYRWNDRTRMVTPTNSFR